MDVQRYISEFARPLTRPRWREGGPFKSDLFYSGLKDRYKRTGKEVYLRAYGRSRMARNTTLVWSVYYMYV
jgi:hypothetical protein